MYKEIIFYFFDLLYFCFFQILASANFCIKKIMYVLCCRDYKETFDSRSKPNGSQLDELLGLLDQDRELAKKSSPARSLQQFDVAFRSAWTKLASHVNVFGTTRTAEQWLRTWSDMSHRGMTVCQRVVNGFTMQEPHYHLRYAYNIETDQANPHILTAAKEFMNRPLASLQSASNNAWYSQNPANQSASFAPRYPYANSKASTSNSKAASGKQSSFGLQTGGLQSYRFNPYNPSGHESEDETPKKKPTAKKRAAPRKSVELEQIEEKVSELIQPIVTSVENGFEELKDKIGAVVEFKVRKVLKEIMPPNKTETAAKPDAKPVQNSELSEDDLPPVPDFSQTGRYTPIYAENEFGEYVIVQVSCIANY